MVTVTSGQNNSIILLLGINSYKSTHCCLLIQGNFVRRMRFNANSRLYTTIIQYEMWHTTLDFL